MIKFIKQMVFIHGELFNEHYVDAKHRYSTPDCIGTDIPPFQNIRCIIFFQKPNICMLDQVFREKYQYLRYQICIIRYNTKSIFIFHLFRIIDVNILFYNLGQTYTNLTCAKINTLYILEQREYLIS